jgi:hypothetical protein
MGRPERYLKWGDDVVGVIAPDDAVHFTEPRHNTVVALYTQGRVAWSPDELTAFLAERIVSRDRRDIERILFRCGLSSYDVMALATVTRAIHPRDLLWLASDPGERYADAMTAVFRSVFVGHVDAVGESVDSPEGFNIKRYAAVDGRYGIVKRRISPLATDVESEVAVAALAGRLGVPCCPARRVGPDEVFSEFRYDFSREFIVHFRRLFSGPRGDDEYQNLVGLRPQYKDDFVRMIALDYVTRQDDRHLSNMAVKYHGSQESFYPLFDNGRSLFYEDRPDLVARAVADPPLFCTTFGPVGTYHDALVAIRQDTDVTALLDLNVTTHEIHALLEEAGFEGYRLDGATEWIDRTLEWLRS